MASFFPKRLPDAESRLQQIEDYLARLGDSPVNAAVEAQAEGLASSPQPDVTFVTNTFVSLLDTDVEGAEEGDLPVFIDGFWVAQQWSPGVLGIGMSAATDYRFEVQDETSGPTTLTYSAQSVDTLVAYVTQLTTPNSGLRGLHLQKKSDSVIPLGITLEYDTEPLWDTVAIDATTTDLVLAFSHALKADNFRMRRDTAQYAIGRIVGQPAIGGGQEQMVAGNMAAITNITQAVGAVVTVGTDHHFAVGETVAFKGVLGMTAINSVTGTITAVDSTTITTNIDSSGFGAYTSGGQVFVQMNGLTVTGYGNHSGLLLLQGVTATRRTKIQFGLSGPQMGSDASQDNTNDWWLFVGSIFAAYADATGHIHIGGTGSRPTPTAKLHLGAGTTSASSAPLKLTSGTNMTTAETGALEYDGTNLYFTPTGTTRRTVDYLPVSPPDYTITNHTDARSLDETGATLAQVANTLGTLINDLIAQNRLQ